MHQSDRIIRLKTVLSRTGLSRSTIYRKIAEGTFPAQLQISTNGTGWHESDINRWVENPVTWRAVNDNDASARRTARQGSAEAELPQSPPLPSRQGKTP
jgi:prophage regulatory protein